MKGDGTGETNLDAEFLNEGVFWAVLGCVLAASNVDVWAKGLEEFLWAWASTQDGVVYHTESFEEEDSVLLGDIKGMGFLHKAIGHHRYNEAISEGSGLI